MTKPQHITLTLTLPQFEALGAAVADRRMQLEDQIEDKMPGAKTEAKVLDNAWDRLKAAWYRAADGF